MSRRSVPRAIGRASSLAVVLLVAIAGQLTVAVAAALVVVPNEGQPGAELEAQVSGYPPGSTIEIHWDAIGASDDALASTSATTATFG